ALDARQLRRDAHAHDGRKVLGAGAIAALLSTADDEGSQLRLRAHPQRPGSGRTVEIVRRQREEIDATLVDGQPEATDRADTIDVERDATPAYDAADLGDRLHGAHFAVRGLHRDERRLGCQRATDRVRIDAAVGVDGDI